MREFLVFAKYDKLSYYECQAFFEKKVMTEKKRSVSVPEEGQVQIKRLVPTQQRSRERYELILSTAAEIISEQDYDALTMSEIVKRTEVPFGSLYQYFPDKLAIIGTLAERYNLEGRACVEAELTNISSQKELHAALLCIIDGYYRMFLDFPLMRDIWHATQADRALQQLDAEDMDALAKIFGRAIQKLYPDYDPAKIMRLSVLIMHLIAAAVRHAISVDPQEGAASLATFKRILPEDLTRLLED